MTMPPPRSTLFPYTTLFRSQGLDFGGQGLEHVERLEELLGQDRRGRDLTLPDLVEQRLHGVGELRHAQVDRKSTRLNSSHEWISYAVFCLKKKKQHRKCPSI